jgi:hypothetical protein
LIGTNLVTRPLMGDKPMRKIGLIWRDHTARREEFCLLAKELLERARLNSKQTSRQ